MEKLRLAIGSDHGGFELKKYLLEELVKEGYEINDLGTYSLESCNYPTYAFKVAEQVKNKEADFGIVICTSGEGVCICANKVKGIRCGLAYNLEVAKLIREHNNCNCIAFGAKYITKQEALEAVKIFLNTPFGQGRHQTRVDLITSYEEEHFKN